MQISIQYFSQYFLNFESCNLLFIFPNISFKQYAIKIFLNKNLCKFMQIQLLLPD